MRKTTVDARRHTHTEYTDRHALYALSYAASFMRMARDITSFILMTAIRFSRRRAFSRPSQRASLRLPLAASPAWELFVR